MDKKFSLPTGINGATGQYRLRPSFHHLARTAQASRLDEQVQKIESLSKWRQQFEANGRRGLRDGHDPCDLAQAGWGVIFAADEPLTDAIRIQLQPLLARRQSQAGACKSHFFRELVGKDGYRPGESKYDFLARHGAGPGIVDPHYMPYYLLIVGDPTVIPYEFQYDLDIEYAVGRLFFPNVEEYGLYAESVVAQEEGTVHRSGRAVLFAPSHPYDYATSQTGPELVEPLAGFLGRETRDWQVESVLGDEADKPKLGRLLGGEETPDLLFTVTHGVFFTAEHPRLIPDQGALVCREWPGPSWEEALPRDFYFNGDDVAHDANFGGLISFHFACFSGGTPSYSDFCCGPEPDRLAPDAFVASLPQRLLGRENGALAAVGHIEQVWTHSFLWPGEERPIRWIPIFEDAIKRLLTGYPVGAAMELFGAHYASLAASLAAELQLLRRGKKEDPELLAGLWTWCNDARNYAVLGDPAVRLQVPPPPGTR